MNVSQTMISGGCGGIPDQTFRDETENRPLSRKGKTRFADVSLLSTQQE
jgi:hypothetical protein